MNANSVLVTDLTRTRKPSKSGLCNGNRYIASLPSNRFATGRRNQRSRSRSEPRTRKGWCFRERRRVRFYGAVEDVPVAAAREQLEVNLFAVTVRP